MEAVLVVIHSVRLVKMILTDAPHVTNPLHLLITSVSNAMLLVKLAGEALIYALLVSHH